MGHTFVMRCMLLGTAVVSVGQAQITFNFTTIDRPGADRTELNAINTRRIALRDVSTIVGTYHDINGDHGFTLAGNVFTDVPAPNGATKTSALGIDNAGEIVGTYTIQISNDNWATRPYLLRSGIETAPFFPCFAPVCGSMIARDIANTGAIVGHFSDRMPDETYGSVGLYEYPGASCCEQIRLQNSEYTYISGVNDLGYIVGYYYYDRLVSLTHGYLRGPNGGGSILDYPNAKFTYPWRINNHLQIVGTYRLLANKSPYRGFLWDPGFGFIPIDYPGAISTEVRGISNPDAITGQIKIVGMYMAPDGRVHGFLAKSVVPNETKP